MRREGWQVNHKLVYRIYREEGLSVRSKYRRKSASHLRIAPPISSRKGERWAMDFVADQLSNGRRFRAFTLIDTYTRECLAIEVAASLKSKDVSRALEIAIAQQGKPEMITCDNGSEFRSRHFDAWAYLRGIKLDFIRPGRPVENGHIESFNGKLRNKCLSANWFLNLDDARTKIEDWRQEYNYERPHSALSNLAPKAFAAKRWR